MIQQTKVSVGFIIGSLFDIGQLHAWSLWDQNVRRRAQRKCSGVRVLCFEKNMEFLYWELMGLEPLEQTNYKAFDFLCFREEAPQTSGALFGMKNCPFLIRPITQSLQMESKEGHLGNGTIALGYVYHRRQLLKSQVIR